MIGNAVIVCRPWTRIVYYGSFYSIFELQESTYNLMLWNRSFQVRITCLEMPLIVWYEKELYVMEPFISDSSYLLLSLCYRTGHFRCELLAWKCLYCMVLGRIVFYGTLYFRFELSTYNFILWNRSFKVQIACFEMLLIVFHSNELYVMEPFFRFELSTYKFML